VSSRALVVDAMLALVLAVLVLIVSPGAAVTGMIGVVVVIACAISFAVDRRARRIPVSRRVLRKR